MLYGAEVLDGSNHHGEAYSNVYYSTLQQRPNSYSEPTRRITIRTYVHVYNTGRRSWAVQLNWMQQKYFMFYMQYDHYIFSFSLFHIVRHVLVLSPAETTAERNYSLHISFPSLFFIHNTFSYVCQPHFRNFPHDVALASVNCIKNTFKTFILTFIITREIIISLISLSHSYAWL